MVLRRKIESIELKKNTATKHDLQPRTISYYNSLYTTMRDLGNKLIAKDSLTILIAAMDN
jgi:hypothetical protein